jgi:sec-independent protein translocase protein TatA
MLVDSAVALPVVRAMIGMSELLIILAIVVVLFGATKLPQLGKGLGEAIGNFKKAQRDAARESLRHEVDATPRPEVQVDVQSAHLDKPEPKG